MSPHITDFPLASLEPHTYENLLAEIHKLHTEGSSLIAIAHLPKDPAYHDIRCIEDVYASLEEKQRRFDEEQNATLQSGILYQFIHRYREDIRATQVLRKVPILKKSHHSLRSKLDAHRASFLYADINASPWMNQGGRALALLTITSAHELEVISTSLYQRTAHPPKYIGMGGPLSESDLYSRFFSPGNLHGLRLLNLSKPIATQQFTVKEAHLHAAQEFLKAPISNGFRKIVRYCLDGIGIRERKTHVNTLIVDHLNAKQRAGSSIGKMTMLSVGCGTALPVLEAMAEVKRHCGQAPHLILLDQDPIALKAAEELARHMGLDNHIELQCHSLFTPKGRFMDISTVLNGRQLDVIEDSGLREYLPDSIYVQLTHSAMKSLTPGGLMVTSNMNVHRAQKAFLRGLMGWPIPVIHRTIREGIILHQKAGIAPKDLRIDVLPSGVYTVFSAVKP